MIILLDFLIFYVYVLIIYVNCFLDLGFLSYFGIFIACYFKSSSWSQ